MVPVLPRYAPWQAPVVFSTTFAAWECRSRYVSACAGDGMTSQDLFAYTDQMRGLMERAVEHARARISHELEPLRPAPDAAELEAGLARAISPGGIGPEAAFTLFTDLIAPNCL